jgi:hypothetical protein
MSEQVVEGAELRCSFSTVPGFISVLPLARVTVQGRLAASVRDCEPFVNISSFEVCSSPANPAVEAGAPEGPCVPEIVAPWEPGAENVLVGGFPALNEESMCECALGGVITIAFVGGVQTMIP